jgi:hypothetical protein
MLIVRAKELDPKSRHHRLALPTGDLSDTLGRARGRVEGPIRNTEARRAGSDFLRDRVQELALSEGPVVGDVVGLPDRTIMVKRKEQTLNYVRYVDKRKGVITGSDHYPPSSLETVGYATEVQLVAWAEEGTRSDNDRRQVILDDHPSHKSVPFDFGEHVRLPKRLEREVFGNR